MVDTEFYISGKKIFDVGFRPGLVALADEVGVKVHATNLRREEKVRVITSGSQENIDYYFESIQKHLVPTVLSTDQSDYMPLDKKEYNGPEIDWYGYNMQFMSAQLSKTMSFSSMQFTNINQKLDEIIKRQKEPIQ